MLYLFAASYPEAAPLIRRGGWRKRSGRSAFLQFQDGEGKLLLSLSGSGQIAAASAVSSVLSSEGVSCGDFLLSFGSARRLGSFRGEGMRGSLRSPERKRESGFFLLNKLVNLDSGRSFYPDMLYDLPFPECTGFSGERFYAGEESGISEDALFDRESAAIYEAGSYYLPPDRMLFLRLLQEDAGEEQRNALFTEQEPALSSLIGQLQGLSEELRSRAELFSEEEEAEIGKLSAALHCSLSMDGRLRQLLLYQKLSGEDWREYWNALYRLGELPCRDKKEGKRVLERALSF